MSLDIQHPEPQAPASVQAARPLYRFTLDQYHRMAETGILLTEERVELLEGFLLWKRAKHPPHILSVRLVQQVLSRLLPPGWHATKEDPVALGTRRGQRDSEPEPDGMVVRGDPRDYADHHPCAGDVPLVVEVADTSYREDRTRKLRIYARAGISVYWIVNMPERRLEVHTEPSGPSRRPSYGRIEVFEADAEVPVWIDGREIGRFAVRDVLP